ncbi:Txe/YoeB family addiction module toxin [Actinoplanes sp. RD1]|uniref:Txe/YoeB family addiction module toxin n=1 Tax=Actinoplanes sp. RD1 TaxID=3064538 RepID=UPI002740E02D|nr:Txe/YoeB family addiction module toxin [Actinoplanes sp. RD1]
MSVKRISWTVVAGNEYLGWASDDKQMVKRINTLVRDIVRDDSEPGLGKPEMLRGDLAGWSSRRINREHRLVYRVADDELIILSCRFHYTR